MRFLLFLVVATSLLRRRGTTAETNVILSCFNQSCVFFDLDPCVEYVVFGSAPTISVELQSVELQFRGNPTSCDEVETNAAVTAWEVQTESNYSDQTLPLLVTAQQLSNGETQTWTLPGSSQLFNESDIGSISQIICPQLGTDSVDLHTNLIVNVLSRNSSAPFAISVRVSPVKQFNISSNGEYNISVSGVLSPQVRYYQFPDSLDTIFISFQDLNDNSTTCMVISMQSSSCPVNDELETMHSVGKQFFTMSLSSSLLVQKKQFPGGEFLLSLIPAPESYCKEGDVTDYGSQVYQKDLLVTVEPFYIQSFSSQPLSIALPFLLAVGMLLLSLLSIASPWMYFGWSWSDLCYWKCKRKNKTSLIGAFSKKRDQVTLPETESCPDGDQSKVEEHQQDDATHQQYQRQSSIVIHLPYDDMLRLSGSKVRLIHMTQKSGLSQKYNSYFWFTLAAGILYVLPALQALLYLLAYKNDTGNLDLCYYNFKCAIPVNLGGVSAFNNVYSNLGYVLLGAVFIVFIYLRSLLYDRWCKWLQKQKTEQTDSASPLPPWVIAIRKRLDNIECKIKQLQAAPSSEITGDEVTHSLTGVSLTCREELELLTKERDRLQREKGIIESFGVPHFTGIYYAIGFALIMEGAMSGIYHLCPNDSNFQFDTTFMYILAGMLVIKTMMLRHPDLFTRAHLGFAAFAGILLLAFIGLKNDSLAIAAVIYCILFLVSMIMVLSHTFYNPLEWHELSLKKLLCKCYCKTYFKTLFCQKDENKKPGCNVDRIWQHWRYLWMPVYILVNVILLFVLCATNVRVTRGILALLIINLGLLLVGYLIAKLFARERWTVVTVLWVILGFCFWIPAMLFFISFRVYDTNLTAAGSRELNQDCVAELFYDNHDMWHILSALALYATSMGIVTVDDGVVQKSILEIRCF